MPEGVGDRPQGLRRRPLRHGGPGLRAGGHHRPAHRQDRRDGARGGRQRRVRQQDRRHRRPGRAGGVRRRAAPALRGGRRPLPAGLGAGHRRRRRLPRPARRGRPPPRPGRRARTATSPTAATASPRSDSADWRSRAGGGTLDAVVLPALPAAVVIRDVGPRDGLQPEAPVAVADRVRLSRRWWRPGSRRIEAVAFVSPKAVPAMAGAAEVLAAVPRAAGRPLLGAGPQRAGRRAGPRGRRRRAHRHRSRCRRPTTSATCGCRSTSPPTPSSGSARSPGTCPSTPSLSCSFGSPYEGDVPPADVAALARRLRDGGCGGHHLRRHHRHGHAAPDRRGGRRGRHRHRAAPARDPGHGAGVRLRRPRSSGSPGSTRRWAGSGGSPFAAGAAGNLATEELVALLDDLGVRTGIDVEGLVDAAAPGRRAGRPAGAEPGGRGRAPHPAVRGGR